MNSDIDELTSTMDVGLDSGSLPSAGGERDDSSTLSVVVPAFNEVENLPLLCERISAVIREMGQPYEVIIVDDGSSDGTWECIEALSKHYREVRGIRLSRNFGHQAALLAGIDAASGQAVITMDADLQHPPELLPTLIARWRAGADIVNTSRTYPECTPFLKRATSSAFYKVINALSETQLVPDSSDFRVLDRSAVQALRSLRERTCFLRGLTRWIGFSQTEVPFEADERNAGETKYSLRKLMALALTGITSLSTTPLRIPTYVGATLLVLALGFGVAASLAAGVGGYQTPASWWIIFAVMVAAGLQMVALGIVGEYIARIYEETKARPQYLVRESCGDGARSDDSLMLRRSSPTLRTSAGRRRA